MSVPIKTYVFALKIYHKKEYCCESNLFSLRLVWHIEKGSGWLLWLILTFF